MPGQDLTPNPFSFRRGREKAAKTPIRFDVGTMIVGVMICVVLVGVLDKLAGKPF